MYYIIDFIIWAIATIGMTDIVVSSKIMNNFRQWAENIPILKDIVVCYQCAGTHAGWICGIFLLLSVLNIPVISFLSLLFLLGCGGSFLAVLGRVVLDYLVSNTTITITPEEIKDSDAKNNS